MAESLLQIFRTRKLVNEDELKRAIDIEKKSGINIGQVLLKKGIISEFDLVECIGEQYELPVLKQLEPKNIQKLVDLLPINFVRKFRLVPFHLDGDMVKVGLFDPSQLHQLDELRFQLSEFDVQPVIAPESEVLKIIHYYYEEKSGGAKGNDIPFEEGLDFMEELEDLQNSLDLANEAPIIKMVNVMLTNAVNDGASDVHIEPQEKELVIRYRIDGVLKKVLSPPKSIQNGIISRVKIMADLNIAENRLPQDGRIRIRTGGKDIDIRVSSLPTQFGERIVMRLLNKSDYNFDLDNIGFDKKTLEEFRTLIEEPNGIILITGPTGSGKTTTLYASLMHINDESRNIITVEDPVEYQIDGISQVHARAKIGLTFAEGLRSILRQDPDVVMVGEIRDEETARVAVQSALTGHLVFSTLHTNDAPSSISRLLDMKIEPFLISATVKGIVAQRLLRVLCPQCKKKTGTTVKSLKDLGAVIPAAKKKISIYNPVGCDACNQSGYRGRTAIYEFLRLTEKVRQVILEKPNEDAVRKLAISIGMKTLRQSALDTVLSGQTSLEEALRIT